MNIDKDTIKFVRDTLKEKNMRNKYDSCELILTKIEIINFSTPILFRKLVQITKLDISKNEINIKSFRNWHNRAKQKINGDVDNIEKNQVVKITPTTLIQNKPKSVQLNFTDPDTDALDKPSIKFVD